MADRGYGSNYGDNSLGGSTAERIYSEFYNTGNVGVTAAMPNLLQTASACSV
jgi:hypothetical protein